MIENYSEFIQLGQRILNLANVERIYLNSRGGQVRIKFYSGSSEFFSGAEADALTAYFIARSDDLVALVADSSLPLDLNDEPADPDAVDLAADELRNSNEEGVG